MKKQMTILAAAALVASFATAAFAAAPATNISMSGHLDYAVEYHVVDSALSTDFWVVDPADHLSGDADNSILDSALTINWATTGNPNLGTISYSVIGNGGNLGGGTISGTIGATTVKLGTVGHSWDSLSNGSSATFGQSNTNGDGTSYPGAEIIGTLGKMSYDVITERVNTTLFNDTVGLRVAGPIGSVNAYGGVVVDPVKNGLLHVGGSTKLGTADVAVQYAKEIGTGIYGLSGGHGILATASMPVSSALTVVGKVSKVNAELYDGLIMKDSDLGAWDLLGNLAGNASYNADTTNFYGKATYAWSPVGTGYASVDAPGAPAANATFTVGTSYAPMFITDANVSTSNGTSTFTVNMAKTLANGAALSAGAAYQTAATPVTGAFAKVSKKFDWLTVWGGLRKNWAYDFSGFSAGKPFVAAVGASASVAF